MFYQPYSTDWKSYQKENLLGTGFQQILQTGCPETNLIYMGEMYHLQWVFKNMSKFTNAQTTQNSSVSL